MKLNGGRSRDEILAEVESVRSDMDSTLSAIERKLTPGQLVDQGIEYLRSSGANEFLSNLGTSVKQNPVPVALVGVCLAWLMASGRSGANPGRGQAAGTSLRRATDRAWSGAREQAHSARQTLGDAAQAARERFDQARHSASGTAQSAREAVSRVSDTVSGTAQSAREALSRFSDTVSGTAQSARDALARSADVAQRQVERARGGYEWMLREQPLALGAIGVAIGALLAAAAPRTHAEDEWMGEASDRLAERAKEAGREQLERAGEALKGMASSSTDAGSAPEGDQSEEEWRSGRDSNPRPPA
jgi:hypothetical protein